MFEQGHKKFGGRQKGQGLKGIYEQILDEVDDDGQTNKDKLCRIVFGYALKGKEWAVSHVWDRVEGKPQMSIGIEQKRSPLEGISDEELYGMLGIIRASKAKLIQTDTETKNPAIDTPPQERR